MAAFNRESTESAYRTAITTIGLAKSHVTKLVDTDRTTPDLLRDLNGVEEALEADLESYRDRYRTETFAKS